jgi:hypothetical protein
MDAILAEHTASSIDRIPAAMPVRPDHPTSAAQVDRLAQNFWGNYGPTHPSHITQVLRRELPHVYVPSVMRESKILRLLDDTVVNGDPLYIHGRLPGVGVKVLIADYANAYNSRARQHNVAQRFKTISISSNAKTLSRILDCIASALNIPLSATEARRSDTYLTNRILEAAVRQNIMTVAFTRLSKAHPLARAVIADLLIATNPTYHNDLEPHPLQESARRVGIVLADSVPPEVLFELQPDTLTMLHGRYTYVRPFTTYDEMSDVLRLSDIGLHDLDIGRHDDHDMVDCLVENTGGLLAQIHPFLGIVDSITKGKGAARPTAAMFHAAMPLFRRMVEFRDVGTDVHGLPVYTLRPRQKLPLRSRPGDEPSARVGVVSDAVQIIKRRKDTQAHARKQSGATQRKRQTTMADDLAFDAGDVT